MHQHLGADALWRRPVGADNRQERRAATAYDIRRAYATLRREFEPSRVLGAKTADLRDDVDLIIEVLEEAYEILKDERRRDRYRRALEASPR